MLRTPWSRSIPVHQLTVWAVYCTWVIQVALSECEIARRHPEGKSHDSNALSARLNGAYLVLEQVLIHGHVDGGITFLCSRSSSNSKPESAAPSCSLTLRESLVHLNPPNLVRLLELIDENVDAQLSTIDRYNRAIKLRHQLPETSPGQKQFLQDSPNESSLPPFDLSDSRPTWIRSCRFSIED